MEKREMSPVRMEKVEKANRLVLGFIEAINGRQIGTMEKLLHSECIWETSAPAPDKDRIIGRNNIIEYWKNEFNNRLTYSIKVEEIMGLGLRCVLLEHIKKEDSEGRCLVGREAEIFEVRGEEIIRIRSYVKK
jgi:limonene-1,2-epoxide hydrolase